MFRKEQRFDCQYNRMTIVIFIICFVLSLLMGVPTRAVVDLPHDPANDSLRLSWLRNYVDGVETHG